MIRKFLTHVGSRDRTAAIQAWAHPPIPNGWLIAQRYLGPSTRSMLFCPLSVTDNYGQQIDARMAVPDMFDHRFKSMIRGPDRLSPAPTLARINQYVLYS